MSAPVIWIVTPAAVGLVLWFFRRNQALTFSIAFAVCLLLTFFAAAVPIGEPVKLGSLTFTIPTTLPVLGRRFVLTNADHMILVLLYGLGTVWFGLAMNAWPNRLFPSFGLGMLVVMVAAIAVEPFLYAALLVETAVLFSIPLLSPPGRTIGQGLQRYLIFQTLAFPVVLFAGWILGVAEANPANAIMFQRASLFLGLGFAFWLGVFPFYNWLPMMMTETHPFPAGFVLSLLSTAVLLLGLDFINATPFLRSSDTLFTVLRIAGAVMVVTAGLWAAFQVNLARLFGYAVIFETGFALLSISVNSLNGWMLFAAAFLPRLLGLLIFAFSLAVLENLGIPLTIDGLRGLARRYPLVVIGLLAAVFSIGGFPLLAGLPVRLEIFEQLAVNFRSALIAASIGTAGFLLAAMQILAAVFRSEEKEWHSQENWWQRIILGGGSVFLLAFGVFPATFYHSILFILQSFSQLF